MEDKAVTGLREFIWNTRFSRYGIPALLAALLASAALLLEIVKVAPMQAQLERIQRAGQGRAPTHEAMQDALSLPAGPVEQLETFYRFFASSPLPNDALRLIHQHARANGITLSKGEYRILAVTGTRLQRYQAVLPVQGSYPAIRKFIADVLNEMPTVALENVRFERPQIGNPNVNAEIRFTVYLVAT